VPHPSSVVTAHFNVHVAPAFAVSFFTSTPRKALCETCREAGGVGEKTIDIGGLEMLKVTLLVADGLLVAEAVMVTVLPIGT
jgi:hypothetical protein